jgi:hypothetical protein
MKSLTDILILAAAALAVWYFYNKSKKTIAPENQTTEELPDNSQTVDSWKRTEANPAGGGRRLAPGSLVFTVAKKGTDLF